MENLSSFEKGIKILFVFSTFRPTMDVNEISKELGIPVSTVYRLLKVLLKYGLIEQDSERQGYRLGISIFHMGNVVRYQRRIGNVAHPFMEELRNYTEESVILSVVEGSDILIIREIEGIHTLRMTFEEGRRLPMYAGATSRVLMAYLPIATQDQIIEEGLKKYTGNTILDPVKLKTALSKVRKNGYVYSDQELEVGAWGIAAPIMDYTGKVIAGLSVVGPISRFDATQKRKYIPVVRDVAQKISRAMGYRPS
jgi:IclR family KDG regulon transcriptional repressor